MFKWADGALYLGWEGNTLGWQGQGGLKSTSDALKAQKAVSDKFWFSGVRSCLDKET